MKKFLAIALTLLMVLSLGTVALAEVTTCAEVACELDNPEHLLPGESYGFDALGVVYNNPAVTITGVIIPAPDITGIVADADGNGAVSPEEQTAYDTAVAAAEAATKKNALNGVIDDVNTAATRKNWKVSTDWNIGGAMVASVKWDDDNGWQLNLNENYTITSLKKLQGTITFTNKADKNNTVEIAVDEQVSNHLVTIDGYKKVADAEDNVYEAMDNTLYQCDEDNPGYTTFNDGRLLSCTLKMVKNEKAFMFNNEDMIDAVDEKYGDTDARIDCYTFGGSPKFTNDAAFKLQADYANQYFVYTWDGKLHKQDYKWDSINGVYTWTTKTPTSYVISDKELTAADETAKTDTTTDAATKNPDTGANDVVGVAAALAVVSLVAGAAVSLKK